MNIEKFSLYWLEEKLNKDAGFVKRSFGAISASFSGYFPFILARCGYETAGHLINYWLISKDLIIYHRGEIIELGSCLVSSMPHLINKSMSVVMDDIFFRKNDFKKMINSYGIDSPPWLDECDE